MVGVGAGLAEQTIAAATAGAGTAFEEVAEGVHEGGILLLGEGLVVAGEGLGGGVLDAQSAGDLTQHPLTSRRSPCSWITFRKKISFAYSEILLYGSRFRR